MAIYTDIQQGSDEWLALRAGKITASRIADVMAKGRGGNPSASRENYAAELIAERLTGTPYPRYRSAEMQWGTDHEDEARLAYQFQTGNTVDQVAFVDHPRIENAGASPDGLIGDDGGIEIKCPNTATHLKTIDTETVAGKYLWQMQWVMACADRQWMDYISYDPRLPGSLSMMVIRVYRDEDAIEQAEEAVRELDREIADAVERYAARGNREEIF